MGEQHRASRFQRDGPADQQAQGQRDEAEQRRKHHVEHPLDSFGPRAEQTRSLGDEKTFSEDR
jgi:hypothetical protein